MRRYAIFAAVAITLLATNISGTAVAVAFPQIISSYHTSLIIAGWVLGANQLACTAMLPLAGKLCDAYGAKFTLILSVCLFTIGSLLCALAPNIQLLIAFRLIQGIGIGGFLPSGTSIIANEFRQSRQQAIGLMSAFFAIGPIIGPNLGAWLTTAYGWTFNFWVFVPFGVLSLIAILLLIPRTTGDSSPLDLGGAGLLVAVLASIMFGITLMGNGMGEFVWFEIGLLFIVAIISAAIFLRRQARVKNPIVDIEVLQEKRFLAANIYNMILGFALFGVTNFIPLYAVSIFGMSTFDSGFVMTPRSIGVMIASIVSSMMLIRWGYRRPMVAGTVITALSLIFMAFLTPGMLSVWQISNFLMLSVVLAVNGVGQGAANPAANNACIELMPNKIGTITGIRGMFRFIGAAIGISISTLVLNNSHSMQQGFLLILAGTGVILLLTLPLIMIIPKNATVLPIAKES